MSDPAERESILAALVEQGATPAEAAPILGVTGASARRSPEAPMADRTASLIRYAHERIALCRAVERRFTEAQAHAARLRADRGARPPVYVDTPQAVVEAETERRTWQEVLRLLGVKVERQSVEMAHAETDDGR